MDYSLFFFADDTGGTNDGYLLQRQTGPSGISLPVTPVTAPPVPVTAPSVVSPDPVEATVAPLAVR